MAGQHLLLALYALAALLAAGYAHLSLARFTAGRYRTGGTRFVLIATGLAIGYLGAATFRDPVLAGLAFALGFGVVHVPAACILLLKRLRGDEAS